VRGAAQTEGGDTVPGARDVDDLVAHLPVLPDVLFRRLRGAHEYASLVAVHEGGRVADQIDPHSTLEGIPTVAEFADDFAASATHDPARDLLIVEADGQVIGYAFVTWWSERDGLRLYLSLAALLPAYRNRGIGGVMLSWAERRAHQHLAQNSCSGPAMLGANASSTELEATRLLLDHGYRVTFELLEMEYAGGATPVADRDRPLPAGLTSRPVRSTDFRAVWESIQAAYEQSPQNIVADEQQYRRWLANPAFDPALWQVAWDGDAIAGQVLPQITRVRGEIAEVSVGMRWRGQGLARTLLLRGLRVLRECGAAPIRLHCRADNHFGAPHLYHSVGFQSRKRFVRYRKPMV